MEPAARARWLPPIEAEAVGVKKASEGLAVEARGWPMPQRPAELATPIAAGGSSGGGKASGGGFLGGLGGGGKSGCGGGGGGGDCRSAVLTPSVDVLSLRLVGRNRDSVQTSAWPYPWACLINATHSPTRRFTAIARRKMTSSYINTRGLCHDVFDSGLYARASVGEGWSTNN
eukprot:scaffold249550_cov25-Prasinocladus_malaysianus.AAC.3